MNEPVVCNPSTKFSYSEWLRVNELEMGIVRIDESIREFTAQKWLAEIAYITRKQLPEMTVIISSPGGGAYYAFAIYDALQAASVKGIKITAIVEGWAASAAAMIVLQAANTRISRPSARFLLHECRRWVFWAVERTSDIKDEVEEMEKITEKILDVLAARCCRTKSEIKQRMERKEIWMSASEAKDFGLIDEVK